MDFDIERPTLAGLLSERAYIIPTFQRPYRWDEPQWEFLWSDVASIANSGGEEHFMGPLLLTRRLADEVVADLEAPTIFVIDGQQRLVTLAILISALRGKMSEHSELDQLRATMLSQISLTDPYRGATSNSPRIVLNDPRSQQAFAVSLALPPKTMKTFSGAESKALRTIKRASYYFDQKLHSYLAEHAGNEAMALRSLAEAVGRKLRFIAITVESDADAYVFFESLNARGLDLAVEDLVKNLLLGRARFGAVHTKGHKHLPTEVAATWEEVVSLIRDGFSERLSTFLRHHWIATRKFVREEQLYKAVSDHLRPDDADEAVERLEAYVRDLRSAAAKYAWLWSGDVGAFPPGKALERGRARLHGIRAFGNVQVLPLLLAAVNAGVSAPKFVELVRAAETCVIRRSMAGQLPGKIERSSEIWCEKLRVQGELAIQSIVEELGTLAAEGQSPDVFNAATVPASRARYLLYAMEETVLRRNGKERLSLDLADLDIEHVLPQSPENSNWPVADWGGVAARTAAIQRLANFALLSSKRNREIGNKAFWCGSVQPAGDAAKCCKRHAYANSSLEMTQKIGIGEKWSSTELAERALELAKIADETWPLATTPS